MVGKLAEQLASLRHKLPCRGWEDGSDWSEWEKADKEGNPCHRGYVGWGPYEDYLCAQDKGWRSPMFYDTWRDFHDGQDAAADPEGGGARIWDDDLNLVADFYFDIHHESAECVACDQSGYNSGTKRIDDDYYNPDCTGRKWIHDITQDEVQALVDSNRLYDFTHRVEPGKGWVPREDGRVPTAAEVNEWSRKGIGHDAINQGILIRTRAKRLGVWGLCEKCDGTTRIRTSDDMLSLYIWLLHPRKGAGRGIHIKSVLPEDLPEVRAFLRRSWNKHTEHFKWALMNDDQKTD